MANPGYIPYGHNFGVMYAGNIGGQARANNPARPASPASSSSSDSSSSESEDEAAPAPMPPQQPPVSYHTYNNVVHHYTPGTQPNVNNVQNPSGPGVAYHYAPANAAMQTVPLVRRVINMPHSVTYERQTTIQQAQRPDYNDYSQFWVRELDGSYTWRSFGEISRNCLPGKWQLNAAREWVWHRKEDKKAAKKKKKEKKERESQPQPQPLEFTPQERTHLNALFHNDWSTNFPTHLGLS